MVLAAGQAAGAGATTTDTGGPTPASPPLTYTAINQPTHSFTWPLYRLEPSWWRRLLNRLQRRPYMPTRPNG